MGQIEITKSTTKEGPATIKYKIRNFRNLISNVNIPVDVTPLAEDTAESAILTKFLNNIVKFSFEWTITDETTSPIIGSQYAGKTSAIDQREFLMQEFGSINKKGSIEDNHGLFIRWSTTDATVPMEPTPGLVSGLTITMTAEQPITFTGTMEFIAGKVIG